MLRGRTDRRGEPHRLAQAGPGPACALPDRRLRRRRTVRRRTPRGGRRARPPPARVPPLGVGTPRPPDWWPGRQGAFCRDDDFAEHALGWDRPSSDVDLARRDRRDRHRPQGAAAATRPRCDLRARPRHGPATTSRSATLDLVYAALADAPVASQDASTADRDLTGAASRTCTGPGMHLPRRQVPADTLQWSRGTRLRVLREPWTAPGQLHHLRLRVHRRTRRSADVNGRRPAAVVRGGTRRRRDQFGLRCRCPRIPTGRGRRLKSDSVWVRAPPGAPVPPGRTGTVDPRRSLSRVWAP